MVVHLLLLKGSMFLNNHAFFQCSIATILLNYLMTSAPGLLFDWFGFYQTGVYVVIGM